MCGIMEEKICMKIALGNQILWLIVIYSFINRISDNRVILKWAPMLWPATLHQIDGHQFRQIKNCRHFSKNTTSENASIFVQNEQSNTLTAAHHTPIRF